MATLAFATPSMADDRYAAIVMNARTGEVLLEDQADEGRYPASLTKIMTLYMIFEALERGEITMDTRWTASRNAAGQPPSRLGLRRGDVITVEQAIRALVVQSANDVAVLVAENMGGSQARFCANMTARARELGLTETRFVNASGLPDPNQRTTARDMARLGQRIWADFPEYYHFFQTAENTYRRAYGRNHNRLLGAVEGVDGIKTGYTRASGFNLVSAAERNGERVIVVVMGGETSAARDAQVTYLIDGAFEEYARRMDPNAASYANLPTNRLDVQLAPSVLNGQPAGTNVTRVTSAPGGSSALPYASYQSRVIETLAPRTPGDAPIGQGDDASTEEDEEAAAQ
ncbi:MAG: D-alanyl-D-alanine carboxypeptidase family protein [Hyphomonadaceae bacterium]|nr:D-alanyl-D-alanine carboxypeptidase family protein [Hyphomonadaceae bacterium]